MKGYTKYWSTGSVGFSIQCHSDQILALVILERCFNIIGGSLALYFGEITSLPLYQCGFRWFEVCSEGPTILFFSYQYFYIESSLVAYYENLHLENCLCGLLYAGNTVLRARINPSTLPLTINEKEKVIEFNDGLPKKGNPPFKYWRLLWLFSLS